MHQPYSGPPRIDATLVQRAQQSLQVGRERPARDLVPLARIAWHHDSCWVAMHAFIDAPDAVARIKVTRFVYDYPDPDDT